MLGNILIAGLLASFPVLAAGVPAPPDTTTFGAWVDVPLVNVEVFVASGDGQPVPGLTADDFRLRSDGQPVDIQHFAWVKPAAASAGTEAHSSPVPARLVVFIDELHIASASRSLILTELAGALARSWSPGLEVMVVAWSGEERILLPFADRPAAVERVIAALPAFTARQLLGDQDRQQVMTSIAEDARAGPCLFGDTLARSYSEQQRADVLATLAALERLVASLDGLPGRKSVLLVSDGVPLQPGVEAWDYYLELCGGEGLARGVEGARDTSTFGAVRFHRPDPQKLRFEASSYDTGREWARLAALANARGVALYSLLTGDRQAAGRSITQPTSESVATRSGAVEDRRNALSFVAHETGGEVLEGAGSGTRAAERLVGDLGGYYLLSFSPRAANDDRIHPLSVEVQRPGLRVRHRQSYIARSVERRVRDRLLTELFFGGGENPLAVRLHVEPARDGFARLQVRVPLKSLALIGTESGRHGLFRVYVVARDALGDATPVRRTIIPVTVPAADLPAGLERDFVEEILIALRTRKQHVAVAVVDELGRGMSFSSIDLRAQR
ncbi:MAG: VWA domain-containing protein [Acidobacteriota bacterium]